MRIMTFVRTYHSNLLIDVLVSITILDAPSSAIGFVLMPFDFSLCALSIMNNHILSAFLNLILRF